MARKKRKISAVAPLPTEDKPKTQYKDSFQKDFGKKVEDFLQQFEGQGKNILYGIAALCVLGVIVLIIYNWSGRTQAAGQTALGKAMETSQALITTQDPIPGSTQKTFKTEKERAEASVAAFQAVAEKYSGDIGEKAKYFAAVNRLALDRETAIGELVTLAKSNDEVGKMSRFALAQAYEVEGKFDLAAGLYDELATFDDTIVAKETVNFARAGVYEKQDKKQEATDIYYSIAKAANDAKDPEGNPITMSSTAQKALDKLTELDPERAKEIVPAAPDSPFGSLPIG